MAGLEDVRFLRHLCLYSNEITKIDHLEHLTELELLWLNDNNISVIEVTVSDISGVYKHKSYCMCMLYYCLLILLDIVQRLNTVYC